MLLVAVSCLVLVNFVDAGLLLCKGGDVLTTPTSDCKGYYICTNGQPLKMIDCPPGSVFSKSLHACVLAGSPNDDCSTDTAIYITGTGSLSMEEQCNIFGGLIPHPSQCQQYYNCSLYYERIPKLFEQHLMECPYPQLFNVETKQCEHFEKVKCGARKEPVDGCEYLSSQCQTAHCLPCSVRLPSCKGLSDGIHAHKEKLWSPYHVVCYKQRLVSEERCQGGLEGRTQLFHADLNQCVSLDLIPQEHGGMMPDCTGQSNGEHLDVFGRCDRYHICENGRYINTVKCGKGELFDALYGECKLAEKACGPCGNKSDC